MSKRQEKEAQFDWWISSIPDKIITLKKRLPELISSNLDFSVKSLKDLEVFLLDHYTFNEMQQDKELWDASASYFGSSFRQIVPNSMWYIELDDENNVFYNMPVLIVENSLMPPMSPHSAITAMLDRKMGNFLEKVVNNYSKATTS